MRNTTLSRLALLGLASVSSIAFAANTVSGEIRFDGRFTTSQKGAGDVSVADNLERADNIFISRARIDMMGDVAKNWTYGIRLEQSEAENSQIGLNPSAAATASALPSIDGLGLAAAIDANIARAYVQWSGIENIEIMMGRIGVADISADRLYYQPFIGSYPNNMAVGGIVHYSGDHAGFSIGGKAGPVGYSFAVWKQTDLRKLETLGASGTALAKTGLGTGIDLADFNTEFLGGDNVKASNFDTKSLRLGYGGRLSFANKMNATTSYGVGVGYNQAPLNMPLAIATMGAYGTAESSGGANDGNPPAYSVATFNNLTNFAVDGSMVFGAFQMNLGYESQKLKFDTTQAYGATNTAGQVFNQDGKASSFWVEGGYLIMGDSYKFDDSKAVVSGVKLRENQAGLEIVARWGTETRKNALALAHATGFNDFSSDTTTATAAASTKPLVQANVVSLAPTDKYLLLTVDNTQFGGNAVGNASGTQIVVSDETAYESKSSGWAVGLNYYLTENASIRAEYDQRSNDFQRMYASSSDHDSLLSDSVGTLRVRADYSF